MGDTWDLNVEYRGHRFGPTAFNRGSGIPASFGDQMQLDFKAITERPAVISVPGTDLEVRVCAKRETNELRIDPKRTG